MLRNIRAWRSVQRLAWLKMMQASATGFKNKRGQRMAGPGAFQLVDWISSGSEAISIRNHKTLSLTLATNLAADVSGLDSDSNFSVITNLATELLS